MEGAEQILRKLSASLAFDSPKIALSRKCLLRLAMLSTGVLSAADLAILLKFGSLPNGTCHLGKVVQITT